MDLSRCVVRIVISHGQWFCLRIGHSPIKRELEEWETARRLRAQRRLILLRGCLHRPFHSCCDGDRYNLAVETALGLVEEVESYDFAPEEVDALEAVDTDDGILDDLLTEFCCGGGYDDDDDDLTAGDDLAGGGA